MVLELQNESFSHFGPLGYQFKTLQCGPYGVWEGRPSQKVRKRYFGASKMKLTNGFRIVARMFLNHFRGVKGFFGGFGASKRKILHSEPLGDAFKTLQSSPYNVWRTGHHKK